MPTNHVKGDMNVQVVARSRGEHMVVHNITDPPLLRSLLRWSRTFFEGKVSTVFTVRFPSVAPVDEIQMKPCLMMATLIRWSQAESSSWDGGESTVHAHLPKSIGTRWFQIHRRLPSCLELIHVPTMV